MESMELILLDSSFRERGRYTNFDSLVWNERWQSPGDFQLRSYGIHETTSMIPKESFVSVSNSDFIMQVTGHDTDVDSNGNEIVSVTGQTLEHIFAHRPSVHRMGSTTYLDAEYPNGWEHGDEFGLDPIVDPVNVAQQLIYQVDNMHYGRPELSHLQLPLSYYLNTLDMEDRTRFSLSDMVPYYSVDRNSTVLDVVTDLMDLGQVGIATLRPNTNTDIALFHLDIVPPDDFRQGMFVFYRPRYMSDLISFDYTYDDYTSESVSEAHDTASHIYRATEDYVYITGRNMPPVDATGFNYRVSFEEFSMDSATAFESSNLGRSLADNLFEEYASGQSFTLETTGKFPYHDKKYQFGVYEDNTYFLGDGVRLNLQSGTYDAQISEYIRTMDADGYREYPTFKLLKKIGLHTNNLYTSALINRVRYDWN